MIYDNYKISFVLICATGRSGSTTLQRIVNTIPNTNICGECDSAILHLLRFYRSLKKTKTMIHKNRNGSFLSYDEYVSRNFKPCWYNCFNYDQMVNDIKKMIIDFLTTTEQKRMMQNGKPIIIGFKEIRYMRNGDDLTLVKEFRELFPNTKVILNYREDVKAQSKSSWYRKNSKQSAIKLTAHNKRFNIFGNHNANYSHIVTFEDLFNEDKMKRLFNFLGYSLDVHKYRQILLNKME